MYRIIPALLTVLLLLLSGCGSKDQNAFSAKVYPPTDRIATAFQYSQVPPPCRVFAHALVKLPAKLSGLEIQQLVFKEAGARGADLVLIGQTRRMEDDEGLRFNYYGPGQEYLCSEAWCGWKFGYDEWEDQGEWVNIGLLQWGNDQVSFEYPLMMQLALLRCR
ncbi:hypothetical protein [Desulfogranum mediterraneum]|uniref:hypothetical protein n=1 Tax=Desulfogranum mediterraneum TaxID=160661 RepID=UPI000409D32B|nr:hypothetical protein [Desulfogranum mediterraneum]